MTLESFALAADREAPYGGRGVGDSGDAELGSELRGRVRARRGRSGVLEACRSVLACRQACRSGAAVTLDVLLGSFRGFACSRSSRTALSNEEARKRTKSDAASTKKNEQRRVDREAGCGNVVTHFRADPIRVAAQRGGLFALAALNEGCPACTAGDGCVGGAGEELVRGGAGTMLADAAVAAAIVAVAASAAQELRLAARALLGAAPPAPAERSAVVRDHGSRRRRRPSRVQRRAMKAARPRPVTSVKST